ncbi:Gfo/Idh/MocA family protein [Terrabacter terrigena]|uniref:Gfo/Idh/MocA family protein n=1 Tax=Terrabacter terrigena TaxID=574718 RepID=A0ABW3N4M3_9MICO
MPPDQPTVVIAGVGRFGALHARVWTEAGARIVGMCDVDPDRVGAVAARFAVQEKDTLLPRLLDRVRPDAVIVATDEASHAELAITALEAGCHVFVEKPLALSSDDAWRIHATAGSVGRQVVVGQISRFAAPYARMQRSVEQGRVGRLCALRLRRDFSRSWYLAFGERVHPVWESCIHDIDLAIAFVNEPVSRVMAIQSRAASEAAPSVVSALLEFEGGVSATVESAWLLPESAPQTLAGALELSGAIAAEMEALGLEGVLRQRLLGDNLVEWTNAGSFVPDLSLWPDDDGVVGGALRREVDYALDVFRGRRAPDRIPLHQVCWAVATAEAVVESLHHNKAVHLTRDPRDIEVSS